MVFLKNLPGDRDSFPQMQIRLHTPLDAIPDEKAREDFRNDLKALTTHRDGKPDFRALTHGSVYEKPTFGTGAREIDDVTLVYFSVSQLPLTELYDNLLSSQKGQDRKKE